MRFTRSASYAIGIMLRLEAKEAGHLTTAAELAKGCDFPPRYLYRVLRRLVGADLISGSSGPGGGYTLCWEPSDISVLEIVDAVDGLRADPELQPVCHRHRRAVGAINDVGRQATERLRQNLSRISLARLANG